MAKHEHVLDQHHGLNLQMDRLSLMVAAPSGTLPESQTRTVVEQEFRLFAKRLQDHFVYEEADGYLSQVRDESPELAARIDQLLEEHKAILVIMNQLLDMSFEDHSVEVFATGIKKAIEAIRLHELAESTLFEDYLARTSA